MLLMDGDEISVPTSSTCHKVGGGHIEIEYDEKNFRKQYRDEYTNEVLPDDLVRAAIREELNYFNKVVWHISSEQEALKVADSKVVRCRWVLCNKGDSTKPDVRAHLVACEVNYSGSKDDSFYASTPPLESKKMLFAKYADQPTVKGKPMRLSFIDVKKAYFNGVPRRKVYMKLPPEPGLAPNMLGLMVRCVYGTREAGAIWEETFRTVSEAAGFTSGLASPCIFLSQRSRCHLCSTWGRFHVSWLR